LQENLLPKLFFFGSIILRLTGEERTIEVVVMP